MNELALIELWQYWWNLVETAHPTSAFRLAADGKISGVEPINFTAALTAAALQVISAEAAA